MSTATTRSRSNGLVASHVSVTDRSGRVIVDDVNVNARLGRTLVIVASQVRESRCSRGRCAR